MELFDPRLPTRFWRRVKVSETGCWLWTGARTKNGYGAMLMFKRMSYVHRLMFLAERQMPEGMEVDHMCRVKACVNPSHLRAVTHVENVGNHERKLMMHCGRGHEMIGDNVMRNGRKWRCRACHNLASARWYRAHAPG